MIWKKWGLASWYILPRIYRKFFIAQLAEAKSEVMQTEAVAKSEAMQLKQCKELGINLN